MNNVGWQYRENSFAIEFRVMDSIVSQSALSLDLELDFFGPRFGLSNLDFWLTKKFKVCSPRNNIFSSLKIPNKFETHIVETVWCLHILRYISVESTWKSLQWIKCRIRKINLFFVHNNFTTSLLPTNYQMSKLEIEQFYPCQIKINLLYTLTKTDNDFFCNFPFQDSVLIRGQ